MGGTQETVNCCCRRTARTVIAVVALAASVPAFLPSAMAGPDEEGKATRRTALDASPADADYLDLQRQVNDLRSDFLDERERRIGQQMEANGVVLVILGVVIGVGGLWFYARFRAIAAVASIGAAAAPRYALALPGLRLGSGKLRGPSGEALEVLPLPVSAGPEADPVNTASTDGNCPVRHPEEPRLHAFRRALSPEHRGTATGQTDRRLDNVDLDRLEETIADCTEAIRLDPDSPKLYLERAKARSMLDRYEEAVADYDWAICLDPDYTAAYLGRCHAKSELGRHEEAIVDYDRAVRLDPDSASASRDA